MAALNAGGCASRPPVAARLRLDPVPLGADGPLLTTGSIPRAPTHSKQR